MRRTPLRGTDAAETSVRLKTRTSMNKMMKTTGLRAKLVSSYDSRFEPLETAVGPSKSIQAHLGGKLRKVFALPTTDSTPDLVQRLLRELEGKTD